VNRGEEGSSQTVTSDPRAHRFDELERALDGDPGIREPSQLPLGLRHAVEGDRFTERVVALGAEASGVAVDGERFLELTELQPEGSRLLERIGPPARVARLELPFDRSIERVHRQLVLSQALVKAGELDENVSFEAAITETPVDVEGSEEPLTSFATPSQIQLAPADLEQRRRFAPADSKPLVQGECLLVVAQRRLDLAHVEVDLAEPVEDGGFGRRVVERGENPSSLFETLEGGLRVAKSGVELSERPRGVGLAARVTDLSGEVERLRQRRRGAIAPFHHRGGHPGVESSAGQEGELVRLERGRARAFEVAESLSHRPARIVDVTDVVERLGLLLFASSVYRSLKRFLGVAARRIEISLPVLQGRETVRRAREEKGALRAPGLVQRLDGAVDVGRTLGRGAPEPENDGREHSESEQNREGGAPGPARHSAAVASAGPS
jgi:hypothetical protein